VELRVGRPTGSKSPSIPAPLEMQIFLSSLLRAAGRANLPMNPRTKSCQVGRKTFFFDLASHHTTRMFDLENRPARHLPGLAVSPDKNAILYTQLDALNSDIIHVENFR
jgi:hypothetical protein